MKQLLTRLDDELHRRVKERAEEQGRSVNAYVAALLAEDTSTTNRRRALRERARDKGKLREPIRPSRRPSRHEVWEATRGAGTAASEALEAERAAR